MSKSSISLAQLADWLSNNARPANTLNLQQLFGYLFAICCSPVPLTHSDWMPAVFADQLKQVNDNDYLDAIINVHQHVQQDITDFLICLPKNCQLTEPFEANFTDNALHHWSNGFAFGLTLTEHFWDDCKQQAQPQSHWMMLSFFANLKSAQQMAATFQNGSMPIEMLTRHIYNEFNNLIQAYAALATKHNQPHATAKINITSAGTKNSAGIPLINNLQAAPDSNQLIQQAWAADNPVEKVQLAHQVLEQDADNINALMLLAQWEAANASERRDLLVRAINGCENVLGKDFFEKNTGRF